MKKLFSKKAAIIFIAIVVNYVFVELFVWRPLLDYVPVPLRSELGRLAPLAQSSKAGFVPEDYILLVGDSYAEGHGDWLMETIGDVRPSFQAAHVIHDRSGRDVVSFGFRGGYPGHSYTFATTRVYHGLTQYAGLGLTPPKDVIVYFSELNDINDEMISAKIWLHPSTDLDQLADPERVNGLIAARGRDGRTSIEKRWNVFRNAHMFDTFTKLVKLTFKNISKGNAPLRTTDAGFAHDRAYQPNWSRYANSDLRVAWKDGRLAYPKHTVEPFAFHTPDDIRRSMYIFKAALNYLQSYFPDATLWVAYVPAPLSVYRFQHDSIKLRDRVRYTNHEVTGPPTSFSVAHLVAQSERICAAALAATRATGARFIDTRPHLQRRAWETGYLHGPNDPGHLNKAGYTALAESMMAGMASGGDTRCGRLDAKTERE